MTFRDDRQALRDRAEALEREVERLRAELAVAQERAARIDLLEARVRELEQAAVRSWRAGMSVEADPHGSTPSDGHASAAEGAAVALRSSIESERRRRLEQLGVAPEPEAAAESAAAKEDEPSFWDRLLLRRRKERLADLQAEEERTAGDDGSGEHPGPTPVGGIG